jgi:hypothetical protein
VIGKSHEGGPGRSLILAAQAGPVGGEREREEEGDQDQDQVQKGIVKATTRSGGTVRGRTGGEKSCRRDGLGTYSTRDGGESEGPWQAVEGAGVVGQTG